MKYFRSYPWGLQLLLFLLMIFTMSGFGVFLILTFLPKFSGYNFTQIEGLNEHSPMSLIRTSVIVQGITNLFVFLIPAWIFSYLAHPQPAKYVGLKPPGKGIQVILVLFIMLGAIPVLQMIETLISHIDFGAKVRADQAANDSLMNAFLTMPTFADFVRVFIVVAIIPAVGEEMFFRGILMRFAKKRTRTMVFPIIFTAVIFAYVHTNIYGYLSIFLAGILLAVIYNLTGSLWCNIIGHLFFNGLTIILAYMSNSNAAIKGFLENNSMPFYYVILGAIVFCTSFYLLLKNKTPLPDNWTDDFPPEGPKESEWDFMAKS
jgi:membrane protease YdiL (CAAX protease family)